MTIGRKLMGIMTGLTVAVVVTLTVFLASRELRAASGELMRRADIYRSLGAKELRSAVAFGDKETAREVFEAIALDPDVEAMGLFLADGEALHERGSLSPIALRARRGVTEARTVSLDDQVIAVATVQSLEGPRGTLVVQLSTESLANRRRQIVTTAVIAGAAALGLGLLLAWLTARPIARRIRRIAEATQAVAAGDLERPPTRDAGGDEIGALSHGFDWMVSRLRDLIAEMQRNAATEQERLEALVRARTDELAQRNGDMRQVLENVEQGLLTIDIDGHMGAERSAVVERWFGAAPESGLLWDYLGAVEPGLGERSLSAWGQVVDAFLPTDLVLDQMPSRFERQGRHFTASYREIPSTEQARRFLVVISDATAVVERARAEAEERETAAMVSRLLADRQSVVEFYEETEALLAALHDPEIDVYVARRHVHTIKGNTALYGLESVARVCHELEDAMSESQGPPSNEDVARLMATWVQVTEKLTRLLGDNAQRIEVSEDEWAAVIAALQERRSHQEILATVASWPHERVALRLARFGSGAEALAERLDKSPLRVVIDAASTRLPRGAWQPFWGVFQHVVRNAVAHGVESPAAREAAGKEPFATLTLGCAVKNDALTIFVEDDGPGIDWDRLAAKAAAQGLHLKGQELLFADGLSVADEANDVCGRGVGLSALRDVCTAMGAKINVSSRAGRGTRFEFSWAARRSGAWPVPMTMFQRRGDAVQRRA
jgi:two-component system, chemotaxis family, sensor kinase CheA